jgi:GT2 family glycosyltransferase
VPPAVTIGIVTWTSAEVIEAAIAGVRAQTHRPLQLLVVDNASADATRAALDRLTTPLERVLLDRNTGFSAAHNLAISKSQAPYYLALNPDVSLSPDYVERLVETIAGDSQVGSATGKLLLAADPTRIDSTGIYVVPSQRHFDRGQGDRDAGQYDTPDFVFGVSAAAGLYRRAMLDDVAVDGEVFDEDFFAYREDADLAWRAQLLGWRARYEPAAHALHGRRVRPDARADTPAAINRMSVRNRFLLRIKNQPFRQFVRFAGPALWRDTQVLGYTLLREHSSLPAFADGLRLLPRMWRKRKAILARRRVSAADVDRWFLEPSRPLSPSR